MKTRVITAAVAIPALLLLLLAAPKIVVAVVWGMMLAIGVYELLYRTGLLDHTRLVVYACVMAFTVTLWSWNGGSQPYLLLLLMAYVVVLYGEMMMSHVKLTFDKICLAMMGGFVIPFLLSSLIRILSLNIGRYMVLIPFIIAFGSDSGAYFSGRFFGQHKLAPVISQHKTVEGAVGGIITSIVLMVIYGVVLQFGFRFEGNYALAILYGAAGALAGIFGDLCFSVVKRQTGIKDYGNLLPGHGGILDRFDSMMLVGPLMETLMLLLPMVQ